MFNIIDSHKETATGPTDIQDCLEIKRRAFSVFLQATLSLQPAIEDGDSDRMDNLIEVREKCISAISAMDGQIKDISKKEPDYYARLSDEAREKLAAIADAIEAILDQLKDLNSECIISGTRRINMIQNELSKIAGRSRKSDKGYRQERNPRFVDITT